MRILISCFLLATIALDAQLTCNTCLLKRKLDVIANKSRPKGMTLIYILNKVFFLPKEF